MAVYKQTNIRNDGKFGEVSVEIVVSGDYYELFSQPSAIDFDILTIQDLNEDLEIEIGRFSKDELGFTVHGGSITTTADQNGFDYLAQSSDQNKRFIAVFLDPATTGDINSLLFAGKIDNDFEIDDIIWNGAQWGTTPDPVKELKMHSTNIAQALLKDVNIGTVYKTRDDGTKYTVPGLLSYILNDSGWIDSYVARKVSYNGHFNAGDWLNYNSDGTGEARISNIVALPDLLPELIAWALWNYIELDYPGFYIDFDTADSSISFTAGEPSFHLVDDRSIIKGYTPEVTPPVRLRIAGSGGDPAYIDFHMIGKDDYIYDVVTYLSEDLKKGYGFSRYSNLLELLYGIAQSFGCYVLFELTAYDSLTITFKPRQDFGATQNYIIDPASATLNIKYQTASKDKKQYWAKPNAYAVEGNDSYDAFIGFSPDTSEGDYVDVKYKSSSQSKDYKKGDNDKQLCFSVAPTIIKGLDYYSPNGYFTAPSFPIGLNNFDSPAFLSLTNGLFQKSQLYTNVMRPVAQAAINIENEQYAYDNLASCINDLQVIDAKYYEKEYVLKIPYLNGFSENADGSSPSWKVLKRGNKIVIDSVEYIVIGIKRELDNLTTEIRLQNVSRFALSQPAASLMTPDVPSLIFTAQTNTQTSDIDYNHLGSGFTFDSLGTLDVSIDGTSLTLNSNGEIEVNSDYVDDKIIYSNTFYMSSNNLPVNQEVARIKVIKDGYLTGNSIVVNNERTGGTLGITLEKNGVIITDTGLDLEINASYPKEIEKSITTDNTNFAVSQGDVVTIIADSNIFAPDGNFADINTIITNK